MSIYNCQSMLKRAIFGLVWIFLTIQVTGQHSVSGRIVNSDGGPLQGANIIISELNKGAITLEDGTFSIKKVKEGAYTLLVSFVGYETFLAEISVYDDTDLGEIQMDALVFMGEEVIVNAIRAGNEMPVAFTSITREEIEARNFGQDIPYLLSMTPSLVTTSDAGHGIGYTGMRIRGTDGSRINVTINGIPLNDPESQSVFWVDLPDFASSVDNIQIQRGVGTSTNGASAFGASINFQTRKLEKKAYASYDGTIGSFGTTRNVISAGTGLLHDHFSADFKFSSLHSDGFIDRSWTNLRSYYFSGGYVDEKTILKFTTFTGIEELYQAWNGVPSYMLDSARTYNELGAYKDANGNLKYYDNQIDHYNQAHYQLHFSRVINKQLYFTSALHYTKGSGYYEQYEEDQNLADYMIDDVIIGSDTISESNLIRRKWLDNDFYGIVGSLNYQGTKLSAIFGGAWNNYSGDHFGTIIWAEYPGESEIRHRWYENTGKKSDWNTFIKGNFEAGNRISLFADIQLRGIDYNIDGVDDDLRDITQDHNYLFFNPKAGLNFQIDPYQELFAIVARAGREPSRSNYVDAPPSGEAPVKESLLDYELGYRFKSSSVEAEANFYFMDYTDQLVLTGEINDVGSAIMTNVRDSYRMGVELAAKARLSSKFVWGLNLTLSRNKIQNYTGYVDNWDYWSDPDNEPYQFEEKLGTTDLSFSPSFIVNNQFDFQPVKNLYLNLSTRYVGKQFIDNTSSEARKLDPYFINDLRIKYSFYPPVFKELSIQLQVLNVFNTEYESNAWIYRYVYEGDEEYLDGYYPQAGIHFMAGLSLRF